MSWSLKLRDGDFDVQNAQLGTARGRQKLVQDFRCALLETLGNDDLHPEWGSTLDGGIGPSGEYIEGVVGVAGIDAALTSIESEIRRIGALLQQRQLQRLRQERLTYNKVTLTPSEILIGISNVRTLSVADTVYITVTLQTGSDELIDVSVPVTDESLVAR